MNGRSRCIVSIGVGIASLLGSAFAEPLVTETVVDAPVEEVWKAFTTEDGMTSWMVPHAKVDLRVGGKMLTNYHVDGKLGDENTIENTILSFEPNRMLSLKATGAPESFPFKDAIRDMWSVTYFEPVGPKSTRVRVVGLGYGEDEVSEQMREFFDRGNARTLEQLRKRFAEGDLDGDKRSTAMPPRQAETQHDGSETLRRLRTLVGGEWIHENTRDTGEVFRVRNVIRQGPHDTCLVADAWLGDADAMFYHGNTQIWVEPESGDVRFQNVNERGAISRGQIRLEGDDRLVWDWGLKERDGREAQYDVSMEIVGKNRYRFVLAHKRANGDREQKVDAVFQRVEQAPERFRMIRDQK